MLRTRRASGSLSPVAGHLPVVLLAAILATAGSHAVHAAPLEMQEEVRASWRVSALTVAEVEGLMTTTSPPLRGVVVTLAGRELRAPASAPDPSGGAAGAAAPVPLPLPLDSRAGSGEARPYGALRDAWSGCYATGDAAPSRNLSAHVHRAEFAVGATLDTFSLVSAEDAARLEFQRPGSPSWEAVPPSAPRDTLLFAASEAGVHLWGDTSRDFIGRLADSPAGYAPDGPPWGDGGFVWVPALFLGEHLRWVQAAGTRLTEVRESSDGRLALLGVHDHNPAYRYTLIVSSPPACRPLAEAYGIGRGGTLHLWDWNEPLLAGGVELPRAVTVVSHQAIAEEGLRGVRGVTEWENAGVATTPAGWSPLARVNEALQDLARRIGAAPMRRHVTDSRFDPPLTYPWSVPLPAEEEVMRRFAEKQGGPTPGPAAVARPAAGRAGPGGGVPPAGPTGPGLPWIGGSAGMQRVAVWVAAVGLLLLLGALALRRRN